MYQLLTLFTGVMTAVMVSLNGNLALLHGAFPAAAIVHGVGSLFALALCALQREKRPLTGHGPWWIYLGGAIGVLTLMFQNMAFGRISVTSIVALALLGQTAASLAVDHFGLFGMEKRAFPKSALLGLALALAGIGMMLDGTVAQGMLAVAPSFGSGVAIVLSRTVNARLAEKTGALRGSLVNHLVGLPITVLLALLFAGETPFSFGAADGLRPWIYGGGALGVLVVLLCNVTVPRISAFTLTVLTFVGQVFAGIGLDVLAGESYSDASFAGGLLIALGIGVNMALERVSALKERRDRESSARPEGRQGKC